MFLFFFLIQNKQLQNFFSCSKISYKVIAVVWRASVKDCLKTPTLMVLLAFQPCQLQRLIQCHTHLALGESRYQRVSMGWWLLRLSAKILALLRLSVNFFQSRLTKKLKINFFCFKELNIDKPVFFVSSKQIMVLGSSRDKIKLFL